MVIVNQLRWINLLLPNHLKTGSVRFLNVSLDRFIIEEGHILFIIKLSKLVEHSKAGPNRPVFEWSGYQMVWLSDARF
jgi:hypothetical protein